MAERAGYARQQGRSVLVLASPYPNAAALPQLNGGYPGVFHKAGHSLLSPLNAAFASTDASSLERPSSRSERRGSAHVHGERHHMWRAVNKVNRTLPEAVVHKELTPESATEKLTEAMEGMDVAKLLRALGQAKIAGVESSKVDEGTQLVQKLEAKSSLKRAIQEEDILDLEEALTKAQRACVEDTEIKEGLDLMKFLQAEERLHTAIRMKDKRAVQWALEHAIEGVRQKKVDEALLALRQIEQTAKLKMAMHSKRGRDIKEALDQARAVGVSGQVVDEAQHIVEQLQSLEKTKTPMEFLPVSQEMEILAQAAKMRDAGALRMAIRMAKDAGVPKSERAVAEKALAEVEAHTALEKAMKAAHKDRRKLQDALTNAELVGFDSKELLPCRRLIAQMDVNKDLDDAVRERSVEMLQDAIEKAKSAHVGGMPLEKAERMLEKLEQPSPLSRSSTAPALATVRRRTGHRRRAALGSRSPSKAAPAAE